LETVVFAFGEAIQLTVWSSVEGLLINQLDPSKLRRTAVMKLSQGLEASDVGSISIVRSRNPVTYVSGRSLTQLTLHG
jgi:hypothetical protein